MILEDDEDNIFKDYIVQNFQSMKNSRMSTLLEEKRCN